MALGSTQPLTEMSTRCISWGKGGRCVRLTILPPSCAVVMKSGNLNFLESSGPLQVCNGTALPLPSSGSWVFPCGRSDEQTDKQDTMKLIVAFRNFANVPKNIGTCTSEVGCTYRNFWALTDSYSFLCYIVMSFSFFVIVVSWATLTLRFPFFLDVAPRQWMIAVRHFETK
jgi:hypothetical protein